MDPKKSKKNQKIEFDNSFFLVFTKKPTENNFLSIFQQKHIDFWKK